ncbi:MAG TPA: 50S ribosomal protein L18e [archaeon]|nr:50S ribosomal protein L18e [archaeon]
MKRTGPMNEELRRVIVSLEKQGRKTGKKVWKDLSQRLSRPSRNRTSVNLYRLEALAGRNAGKILIVPGKVLSTGALSLKIEVACVSCSENAERKISALKGKVVSMEKLIEMNPEAGKMVIVQ